MSADGAHEGQAPRVLNFGPHPDQRVEIYHPPTQARGTLALIHGGYWRERFTCELMRPLALHYLSLGWSIANLEYRRGPAQPWPEARDDVRTALGLVRQHTVGPLIILGHSVGGQLALLAADLGDRVVALAPVTDAARTFKEHLGDDAAQEYFPVTPEEDPALYDGASPLHCELPPHPALLVHGVDDTRVPLAHTLDFMRRAWAAAAPVDLLVRHQLDHLALIDPTAAHWAAVDAWLSEAR